MHVPSTAAVRDLLTSLFSGDELEMFATTYYRRLATRISWRAAIAHQAFQLIELWRTEGLYANGTLYARLRKERPHRTSDIDAVEQAVRLEQAAIVAQAPPLDESMEQHVCNIEERRQIAWSKAETEPRSAAHIARLAIEEIMLQLHFRELGPTHERAFDRVLERLGSCGVIPTKERLHFATVLQHGGFWLHATGTGNEPSARDLETMLASLDLTAQWYFEHYLNVDVLQILRARDSLSPIAPPDMTPVTVTSGVGTLSRSLDGEIMPIWRGRQQEVVGRVLLAMPDGEVIRQLELRIDPFASRHIGRKRIRRDGQTRNDLVIPVRNVSNDQAIVEANGSRVVLHNTSTKANVAVGREWLDPGMKRHLHHRVGLRFGSVGGVFLDARLYESAPEESVDAATGLLSRDGLSAEIALTLEGRRERVAFFARYSPENESTAMRAAHVLHHREPELPVARMGNVVALICNATRGMDTRLDILRAAALHPSVSGFLLLEGASMHANAIIEAAVGALSRLAASGAGADKPVNLARYAVPSVPLETLTELAADAYPAGGGIVVFVLGDVLRLVELGHHAHAALELEFREMLGAALGPADCICPVADGTLAVLTCDSAAQLAREQPARWQSRGPVQVGVLEIDRCVRVLPVAAEQLGALLEHREAFVQEATAGIATHPWPVVVAHPLERAMRASSSVFRVGAALKTLENTWRLVASVLAAAHRQRFPGERLQPPQERSWLQPWLAIATQAATQLLDGDARIAELAGATQKLASVEGLAQMRSAAGASTKVINSAITPAPHALERVFGELRKALREALTTLSPLRGWSLVAVRSTRALDLSGRSLQIDYSDFTGPHPGGVPQRISVTGLPVHEFVYFARWAEGVLVVLDPWIRRARNPQSGRSELFLIEDWPEEPGSHTYRAVTGGAPIQLDVTRRHLGR